MITYILIQTQNLKKNQGTMEREIFPWRVFETETLKRSVAVQSAVLITEPSAVIEIL